MTEWRMTDEDSLRLVHDLKGKPYIDGQGTWRKAVEAAVRLGIVVPRVPVTPGRLEDAGFPRSSGDTVPAQDGEERLRVLHHPCDCDGTEALFCEEKDGTFRTTGCCRECHKAMPCPTIAALEARPREESPK